MKTSGAAPDSRPRVRLRSIAFPIEHGGWGFLAEPVLLAMLVAPSVAGLAIALSTVAAFLIRHPSKMYWRNRHRLDVSPRYRIARNFTLLYGGIAVAGFVAAAWLAGPGVLVPFLVLSPLLAVFAFYDANNKARNLFPELAAPMGLAASAPAIALAGGWGWPEAWAVWLILQARAVPSILYVRSRLRLERGAEIDRTPSTVSHVAAMALVAGLWSIRLAPLLTVAALGILLARSIRGLSHGRRKARAKEVGFAELGFGLSYVLITSIGYWIGL